MNQELKPKLRPIAAFPVETKDGRFVVLKDMTGISPEILTVNEPVLFLLQFFDGNHSIADIKVNFFKRSGRFLYDEQIEPVISKLEESHFLEGESFERYLATLREEFKHSKSRKAAHAGSGYPADREELKEFLAGFFRDVQVEAAPPVSGRLAGMIVPHLDLRLAGNLYARAYSAIRKSGCRTFIVMGTGHSGARYGYILTEKDFETPLGTVKCDRELTKKILDASPYDLTCDEFLHKNEHTIEFQALFLKYIFPDEEIRIVPVLCSFDYRELKAHPDPGLRAFLSDFPRILADIASSQAINAAYLASVDFAHVGPRYGDRFRITDDFLEVVREKDADLIRLIGGADRNGFIRYIEEEKDSRRICGFAPISAFLTALDRPVSAFNLGYGIFKMGEDGSYVSAASMVFTYDD